MSRRFRSTRYDTQILHGDERERYGVTVTFRRGGELLTKTRAGKVREALQALLDETDPSWQVVSISTPNTVYRDVVGGAGVGGSRPANARSPELVILGMIGEKHRLRR